jgi:hypothetical protein
MRGVIGGTGRAAPSGSRTFPLVEGEGAALGRAGESKACPKAATDADSRYTARDSTRSGTAIAPEASPVRPAARDPLPDATAEFVEGAGRLAAAAVARGDRAEAQRLLEGALAAVNEGGYEARPVLRIASTSK